MKWKRTRHSHRAKLDPEYNWLKQTQLNALEQVAQLGGVELMYLDESGCCLWSPVSYSYSRVGEQKRIEQTDRRNGRISILGLWQPDKSFKYALASGSFKVRKLHQIHRLDCRIGIGDFQDNRTDDRNCTR